MAVRKTKTWLKIKCPTCHLKFETRNPRKRFCRVQCRVEAWQARRG